MTLMSQVVAEQAAPLGYQPPDRIERFLRTAEFLVQLIDKVWQSDLIPVNYRGSRTERYSDEKVKANLLAAGLLGDSLGVDPFMAWSNIYPTQAGKLGLSADFKVALVTGRGHEIETVKRTPTECVVRARRKGSDLWQVVTITIEDAQRANWTRNPVYGTRPEDMLFHRARGRAADMVAPDATHGIPTVDDLDDIPMMETPAMTVGHSPAAIDVPRRAGDRIRAGIVGKLIEERQPVPADSALAELVEHTRQEREQIQRSRQERKDADAEAGADDLVAEAKRVLADAGVAAEQLASIADNTVTVEEDPGISAATWGKINGLFRAVGITGNDQATGDARLRVIHYVTGRPVERGSQMATWEGEQVMEYLGSADPLAVHAIAYPTPQEETQE